VRAIRVLVACLVLAAPAAAEPDAPLPEVVAALARVGDASTIELTTTGRRSGRLHTRPIWFVVRDGAILVQSGKEGKTDWYRNVLANPTVTVRADRYTFRGRARPLKDPEEVVRVHRLFLDKYTSARLLSWVGSGIGRGLPVEIAIDSVSVARAR